MRVSKVVYQGRAKAVKRLARNSGTSVPASSTPRSRYLIERSIERQRKPAGGVVVAGECFGDGGAAFFAGYQASSTALACCCAQLTASALPFAERQPAACRLRRGPSAGLPALLEGHRGAIAATEAFELDGISSPSSDGERPTKATTTSACFAAATASSRSTEAAPARRDRCRRCRCHAHTRGECCAMPCRRSVPAPPSQRRARHLAAAFESHLVVQMS